MFLDEAQGKASSACYYTEGSQSGLELASVSTKMGPRGPGLSIKVAVSPQLNFTNILLQPSKTKS